MERLDDRRYPGIAEPRLYRRAGVVGRGPFEEILPHLRERFLVPRHASPVARHRCGPKLALVLEDRLECVAADPDFSTPPALSLLKTKVWQLERSWSMLYDAMPEKQAEQILSEVFPDEPRA